MPSHELLLISIEAQRLHEDAVLNADLANVMEHPGEFDSLDLGFIKTHLTRHGACDAGDTIRVATGEAVFRVDCLRERGYGAEEQVARLGVLREGIAREQ